MLAELYRDFRLRKLSFSRILPTALSLAYFALVHLSPCFADDFKQAMSSYQKKDYKEALRLFSKAAKADPYNSEIHYYMANSHMFLHDGKTAMAEYSQSFDLDPLSKYGQRSRQALLGFGDKFSGFGKAQSGTAKHLAPDDGKSIKQAVKAIKEQTGERENINNAWGEYKAKLAVEAGEETSKRVNGRAQELMEELAGNNHGGAALQQELHEIHQRAVFEGQRARQDAREQAARHMSAAVERSASIESSASNLLKLISEKAKPGKVKLKAAGTNLYVRSYDSEPAPAPEPLLANWELLPAARALSPERETAGSALRSESPGFRKEKIPGTKRLDPPASASVSSKTAHSDRHIELTQIDGRVILHLRDLGK